MNHVLERLALATVREQYPYLQRSGFAVALRRLTDNPDLLPLGFTPDGWWAEEYPNMLIFYCIEVEDHHPLTPEKLSKYCELWDSLEWEGHYLRLLVFDRYGHNERELDLYNIYFNTLGMNHGRPTPL